MTGPGFGDRRYEEADLLAHYAHHPHAPVQFALGNALREAYVHAQHHGRLLLQQTYGYNTQAFTTDLGRTRAMTLTASDKWGGLTRGWVNVPRCTSHLVGDVVFALFNLAPCRFELRLSCENGSDCAVVESAALDIDADSRTTMLVSNGQLVAAQNTLARELDAEFPFANVFEVRRWSVSLELGEQRSPGLSQVVLEARANRSTNASTYAVPIPIRPFFAQVRADMRYT